MSEIAPVLFKKDYPTEHIIKEYGADPKVITEVSPWFNPHYFSILSKTCSSMQSYRIIDADLNVGRARTMWEEYVRYIDEECPVRTREKFHEMRKNGKFHKTADWYFNTRRHPSDLILLNESLHWSFPSLNFSKTLRDVKPDSLLIVRGGGYGNYNDHTIGLMKDMKEKMGFDVGIHLIGKEYIESKKDYEYVFEEVDRRKDLVEWNRGMRSWLDRTSREFFVAFQNRGGTISEKECARIMYDSMKDDILGGHVTWTPSISDSFKEFMQKLLPRLERNGLAKQHRELLMLIDGKNPYC